MQFQESWNHNFNRIRLRHIDMFVTLKSRLIQGAHVDPEGDRTKDSSVSMCVVLPENESRLPIEFTIHTCTCRGVHRASTHSVYAALHRYWSTWRQRFWPMPHLVQLHKVASTLSLSSPQSTAVPVVIYIALAAALHAAPYLLWSTRAGTISVLHLRLSWCALRQHNQCLTPRQHWY